MQGVAATNTPSHPPQPPPSPPSMSALPRRTSPDRMVRYESRRRPLSAFSLAGRTTTEIGRPCPDIPAFGVITSARVVRKGFSQRICRSALNPTAALALSIRRMTDNGRVGWSLTGLLVLAAYTCQRPLTEIKVILGSVLLVILAMVSVTLCN